MAVSPEPKRRSHAARPQGMQHSRSSKGLTRATGRDEWTQHHLGTLNFCSARDGSVGSRCLRQQHLCRSCLFPVQTLDLFHQRVNFFRCQLPCILWHPVLAIGNYGAQIIGRCGLYFFRRKRRPAKVSALSIFPVALRAILLKDRICSQTSFRRRRLRGLRKKCNARE